MPETISGREAIRTYIKEKNISITSLATMYGMSRAYLHEVLDGKKKSKAANELVLKIIEDFQIR